MKSNDMGTLNLKMKLEGYETLEKAIQKLADAYGPFIRIAEAVEYLRKDEADTVTILCDNPDGPPNNAVEVAGFWTEFKNRRFEGETLLEALTDAVEARESVDLQTSAEYFASRDEARQPAVEPVANCQLPIARPEATP